DAYEGNQGKRVVTTLIRSSRVLLLNPPIVDLRIPWVNWIEPTGLLRIGALLKNQECDVRLLDCIRPAPHRRQLDAVVHRENQALNRWRFGLRSIDIVRALKSLQSSGWSPDYVLITTLTSFWWLGVPIAVAAIRKVFPEAAVIVGGAYPDQARHHAEHFSGADQIGDETMTAAAMAHVPAIDLYEGRIASIAITGLQLLGIDGAMDLIDVAVKKGATRIHLADHAISTEAPALLT